MESLARVLRYLAGRRVDQLEWVVGASIAALTLAFLAGHVIGLPSGLGSFILGLSTEKTVEDKPVVRLPPASLPLLEIDIKQPFYFARVIDKLARSLADRGEYTKAEERFLEALEMKEAWYGDDEHWSVATTRHGLAQLKFDEGDYEQAERWCRDALVLRQLVRRQGHPDIADSLHLLGEILIARDDLVGAEDRLRKALEMRENETSKVQSRVAETQSVLGGCLAAEGCYEEAEPLLVESLPIVRERWGEQQKHTLAALDRIISLYEAWGKPQEAEEYRAIRAQDTKP